MQIWPQEIRTKRVKNGAGFLSEACPVFQLRQFTSNHIHIFVSRVLLHVTHWAEEGSHCQKIKADTSVIYMDAVVSKMSFNIFQPTSQGNGIFVSGENWFWSILEYTHLGSKLYRLKFWEKKKKKKTNSDEGASDTATLVLQWLLKNCSSILQTKSHIPVQEQCVSKDKKETTFSYSGLWKHEGTCWVKVKSTKEIITDGISGDHLSWSEGTDNSWTWTDARIFPQLVVENRFTHMPL